MADIDYNRIFAVIFGFAVIWQLTSIANSLRFIASEIVVIKMLVGLINTELQEIRPFIATTAKSLKRDQF
jgi:hypothetical protein